MCFSSHTSACSVLHVQNGLLAANNHAKKMRDMLQHNLQEGCPSARINGPRDDSCRLPGTLSIGFPGVVSGKVLLRIRDRVCCSAGSACHSFLAVSPVLKAIGIPLELAGGTLRLSTGKFTTPDDVRIASDVILSALSDNTCKV